MTGPFVPQVGDSALKPMIKYETLSLQVSNAGNLEQATAYISLLTLHSAVTKQQRPPVLSKWHLRNDIEQFTFLSTLNLYCVERICFRISSSSSTNSNPSKGVRSSGITHWEGKGASRPLAS